MQFTNYFLNLFLNKNRGNFRNHQPKRIVQFLGNCYPRNISGEIENEWVLHNNKVSFINQF